MRHLLLALVFVLCLCAPASAGFTAAQHAISGSVGASGPVSFSFTNNPATGSVVCVGIAWFDGVHTSPGTVTVVDGNSNSYTLTTHSPSNTLATTAGTITLAYLIAPANAHKTITVTIPVLQPGGSFSVSADEFTVSGGTAAFDSDIAGTGGPGTTLNTPTVTVSGSGELVYSMGAADNFPVTSVNGVWTQVYASGGNGEAVGYILSRTSNVALNMTMGGSSSWDSMGMSFTFTSSGGGGCTPTMTLLGVGRCG